MEPLLKGIRKMGEGGYNLNPKKVKEERKYSHSSNRDGENTPNQGENSQIILAISNVFHAHPRVQAQAKILKNCMFTLKTDNTPVINTLPTLYYPFLKEFI